ncbi:MAG: PhoH family protein [Gammaproteobacteria bacterium]|nr:PhoH family protein [Gammaproteobacteria bacterium]
MDANLREIETRSGVQISNRGHEFLLEGEDSAVRTVAALLPHLYERAAEGPLTAGQLHLELQEAELELRGQSAEHEDVVIKVKRGLIRGRGANQHHYLRRIRAHDINFGIGPAGTGKTYLAVACAVEAMESDRARRIVLVRPAVEAGERLGFLPGDLAQKVDPYLRPLYDALYEMFGYDRVAKLMERNVIEVAPLAYMRGRTLNESFIILDEAQNTTIEQMKMFLTRIGFGSTAVVTGDVTQIDLPRGQRSGLVHAHQVLGGVEGISFTLFTSKDVVRHPLVKRILDAYEAHEQSEEQGRDRGRSDSREDNANRRGAGRARGD